MVSNRVSNFRRLHPGLGPTLEVVFTDRLHFDITSVRVRPYLGLHPTLRPVNRNRDGRLVRRLHMASIHSIAIR
jgi:hypothetical protein